MVLHPARFRILIAVGHREVRSDDLVQLLPNLSRATVYRHVAQLIEGGILDVVREERVRGAVQRTLRRAHADIQLKGRDTIPEPARIQAQLHAFLDALIGHTAAFFPQQETPMAASDFAFWGELLFLSAEERERLSAAVRDAVLANQSLSPDEHRKPFLTAFLLLPS